MQTTDIIAEAQELRFLISEHGYNAWLGNNHNGNLVICAEWGSFNGSTGEDEMLIDEIKPDRAVVMAWLGY